MGRSLDRLIAVGVLLAVVGLLVTLLLTCAGCTIERFFVLTETNNYPRPQATGGTGPQQ